MQTIGVIDYGAGNVASVMKALDYAGGNAVLVSAPEALRACDKLVLPGVGAAGQAIERLRAAGLEEAMSDIVIKGGMPLLGICVGMQLMAEDLYEYGHYKGLGWVPGKVVSLQECGVKGLVVPHMGWNDVVFEDAVDELSKKLASHKSFYFAHSYALLTESKVHVSAHVDYGQRIVAGIAFDNVRAFQFHPEKSQVSGDILMQWFMGWDP